MAKKDDAAPNTAADQSDPANQRNETPQAGAGDPAPRLVTIGRTVGVSDHETGKVHPAIVTHANDDQSIVATVFKPHETVVGVGFKASPIGLATPGHWHWFV